MKTKSCNKYFFFMFENYVPLNDLKRYNCANEQLVILNILMAELRKFLAKVKVNWRKIGPYLGHYNSVRPKWLGEIFCFKGKYKASIHLNHKKAGISFLLKRWPYLSAIWLFHEMSSAHLRLAGRHSSAGSAQSAFPCEDETTLWFSCW